MIILLFKVLNNNFYIANININNYFLLKLLKMLIIIFFKMIFLY